MTRILTEPGLNDYAERFTSAEPACLAALNRETNMKVEKAVMLSGHLQGAFLTLFSKAVQPRRILEIGTYTGYSAICLAQGLTSDGKLYTIDVNEELQDITERYFETAGLSEKINYIIGNAHEIVPELNEQFDLVFIDADKPGYAAYFDAVINKVVPGGFILADNVLFEGDVLLPDHEMSKNARAMHRFNEKVQADERIEHMLLPLRDGIMIMRKK
jgi:predicted O-methyltransferase YrrM